MSTKDYRQTDVQSKRSIQILIGILRPVIQSEPFAWDLFLPSAEFEINATKQKSKQLTPFEVDIGRSLNRLLTRNLEQQEEK